VTAKRCFIHKKDLQSVAEFFAGGAHYNTAPRHPQGRSDPHAPRGRGCRARNDGL